MKVKSKRHFAALIGITPTDLEHHLQNAEAPALGDVAGWEAFLAAHGRTGSAPTDLRTKIAKKRLEILTETKEAMARKAAREKNETADKGEVRTWMRSFMALLFGELDRIFGMELPASGKGLSEVELKRRVDVGIKQLKETLRKRFQEQL